MASSYSPSLKLELIGTGDQSGTWGTTTNNNLGTLLEQAITGVQDITMVNADYVLTNYNGTSDEARNAVLVVGGTNSAIRQIIAPLINKLYVVTNNTSGGYAITIGGISGSTVTIPNGITAQVYCNGTNFYSSQTGSAGNFTVNGTLTASGLTDTGNMSVTGTLGVTGVTTFAAGSAAAPAITTTGDTNNGIFFPATDATAITTSGTERMRIDSSGNVGIGTTGPTAQLETYYNFSGQSLKNAVILGGVDSAIGFSGIKVAYKNASSLTDGTSYPLQVFTNAAAQFSVTGNGRVLVGTTTASANSLFYVAGSSGFGIDSSTASDNNNKNGFYFQQSDGNFVTSHSNANPAGFFSAYQYGGAVAGYIVGISAGAGVAYTSVSDYRLKEDVAPMTDALGTVAKLRPVTYTWKANGTKANGFIAHELQAVVPDAVTGKKDAVNADGKPAYQGVDTSFLVATLTAAIQEQQAIIKALTARIETLEKK